MWINQHLIENESWFCTSYMNCYSQVQNLLKPDNKIGKSELGQHWSILTFDVSTIQEFYMKEISSMDFPQYGEVFYFYGKALYRSKVMKAEVNIMFLF
jgi:surface polysaccharide O-acyltransferase-like enzyme